MIDHETTGIIDPALASVKKNDLTPIQAVDTGEKQSLEEVWQQLTEIQQEICKQFSASEWQPGLEEGFIDYLLNDIGASRSVIEELVERGVIEAQPAAVFPSDGLMKIRIWFRSMTLFFVIILEGLVMEREKLFRKYQGLEG